MRESGDFPNMHRSLVPKLRLGMYFPKLRFVNRMYFPKLRFVNRMLVATHPFLRVGVRGSQTHTEAGFTP